MLLPHVLRELVCARITSSLTLGRSRDLAEIKNLIDVMNGSFVADAISIASERHETSLLIARNGDLVGTLQRRSLHGLGCLVLVSEGSVVDHKRPCLSILRRWWLHALGCLFWVLKESIVQERYRLPIIYSRLRAVKRLV
jgi:hypothetical protein